MEIRIHAKLAIKSLEIPAIKLWYLCRAVDTSGSGWAYITKQQLQEFGKDRTTIWRWLNNKALFLRYKLDRSNSTYKIYYHSLVNLCKKLGVKSLGGIGWSDTVHNLPAQAALIEAQKRQQQSAWIAKSIYGKKDLVEPEEYFDGEGKPLSDISIGSRAAKGCRVKDSFKFNGRTILMLTKTPIMYGASIKGIAKSLDISYSTAQKLLKDADRVQLAQRVSWTYYWKSLFEQRENMGIETETGFFFANGKNPLKLLPYRYYPLYALTSQKQLRGKLTRLLSS